MSTGRWRVTGLHGAHKFLDWETGETRTEVCTRWGVTSPEGYDHEFFTHAEALAYADQQARTVALALPSLEVTPINTGYGTTISRAEQIPLSTPAPGQWGQRLEAEHGKKGPTIRLNGPYGSIYWCSWGDVKTTALHLLALHYHHERNQK